MRFHENMVYAPQDVRPVKKGFQQIDLCSFDIDLQYADVFIEVGKKGDKVDLPDFDGTLSRQGCLIVE